MELKTIVVSIAYKLARILLDLFQGQPENLMRKVRRLNLGNLIVRAILIVAIAACAIIGLAGLLLPIIPGILFLCLAAVLVRQFGRA